MLKDQGCQATTADGRPCGAPESLVDPRSGLCTSHDPDRRGHLREAARKGGRINARRFRQDDQLEDRDLPPLDSPQAASKWCEVAGRAVATGRLSHNQAKAIVRAVREFLRSHEAGEVAEKIDTLQEKVARLKKGDGDLKMVK